MATDTTFYTLALVARTIFDNKTMVIKITFYNVSIETKTTF